MNKDKKSKIVIIKGNTNKFLSDLFIAPLTKKLSYKNADK